MKEIIGKCPRCGKTTKLVASNNPINPTSICYDCVNAAIDPTNLEHFAFYCRTFNLPINTNLYLAFLNENKNTALERYTEELYDTKTLVYNDPTTDKWKEVEKEWSKVKDRKALLDKIEVLKADFIDRCREKWGEYSYEEYLHLESLFSSIVKASNMTDPTQIDSTKKYCKLSVLVDQYIEGGESKKILEASSALSKMSDLAGISELGDVSSDGTIKTVSDLYKYMEDHGFKFNFYDKVDRDIVDKTIKDIQNSIKTQIDNAIGLDVTYENVKEKYLRSEEELVEEEAREELKLGDIIDLDNYSVDDENVNNILDSEEVIFEDEEE